MIFRLARPEAGMILYRAFVGSLFPAQAIRNALIRRCTSIVAKNRVAMGMMMTVRKVAVVMVAKQNVRQMVVSGSFLETQPLV